MSTEATEDRDKLRLAIEERLDKTALAQADASVETRRLLLESIQSQGKASVDLLDQLGLHIKERLDNAATAQSEATTETRANLLRAFRT
jgi:hypothetical protein